LPHTIPLFFSNEETVYASYYSNDIVRFLENIEVYSQSNLKFTQLLRFIESLSSEEYSNQATELKKDNYFTRVNAVAAKLEYSVKGDTISVWPLGYEHPLRLEFFGEDLESMYFYDEDFGRKIQACDHIILSRVLPEDKNDRQALQIKNYESGIKNQVAEIKKTIFTQSLHSIQHLENFEIVDTDFQFPQLFYARFDLLHNEIKNLESKGFKVFIKTNNKEDLTKELKQYTRLSAGWDDTVSTDNPIFSNLATTNLPAGFISNKLKLAVFTDRELFGSIFLNRPEKVKSLSNNIKKLLRQFEGEIEIGDYVVHEDYGLGIYSGLTQEKIDDVMMEYLSIKYGEGDELLVPIHQIEKITKYIGPEGVMPKLTRLGKGSWESIKAKVKKSTGILARELVEHYAKREIADAKPLEAEDSKEYKQFVEGFKFVETEDQLRAANEIIADLEKKVPMNRLLVGDVGFGKTEVFMRAAFKIVEAGGQVAVLAPTTILTAQHYVVLKERFRHFPVSIRYLSRFHSPRENNQIIDELNAGKVDIIIGTHRLLSGDVKFKNLQLIIVDEEQKFGVKQKEKIKKLNYGVHVLSVSATPIPRTLSMALSSIHDISIISQPPKERKPIHTELIKENISGMTNGWDKVAKAIAFEVERGGQIYFLHNEVQSIHALKDRLGKLVPGIKLAIGHGQMRPSELDRVMTDFYEHRYDELICTTIIENGLDLPNVNTIIINKANRFGLSQLYQLRGRVGRSDRQSYCYLLYQGRTITGIPDDSLINNDIPSDIKKLKTANYLHRLQAMVENQDLGAGFRIASRDLEIRGAGNLLGEQQSGHISTVGYALYIEILAQEVERIRKAMEFSKEPSESK
jgi:transcription-repair coupling factor (superfamily II helicase)